MARARLEALLRDHPRPPKARRNAFLGNSVCLRLCCVAGTAASTPGPAQAPGGSRPGSHTGARFSCIGGEERGQPPRSGQSAPRPLSGPVTPGHGGGAAAGVLVAQEESCTLAARQGQPRGPSGVFTWVGPRSSLLLAGLVALRSWSCQPMASGSVSGKLCSELSFREIHVGHHSSWQGGSRAPGPPRPAGWPRSLCRWGDAGGTCRPYRCGCWELRASVCMRGPCGRRHTGQTPPQLTATPVGTAQCASHELTGQHLLPPSLCCHSVAPVPAA